MTAGRLRPVRLLLSGGLAAALLAVALPRVTGAGWAAAVHRIGALGTGQLAALVVLWLLGLYAHTYVLTAAMPRLSHRQALALNLSGSAVANLVPFGGALGMGLNYRMARSWGMPPHEFAPFTTLSTAVAVLVKLALPVLAAGLLLATGGAPAVVVTAATAGAGLLLVGAATGVVAVRRGAGGRVVSGAQRALDAAGRRVAVARGRDLRAAVERAGQRIRGLVARGWPRIAGGALAYAFLQALLLWAVLQMLGAGLGPVPVFAGFAVGRLLTLLVVTPGGVGSSEAGSAAVLVALGGDPVAVTSGIVLFSALTFALEIPVGGLTALLWWRGLGRRAEALAA